MNNIPSRNLIPLKIRLCYTLQKEDAVNATSSSSVIVSDSYTALSG